jgi:phosphatidylglycerol:prolipoprotein diacylglycerol transferase
MKWTWNLDPVAFYIFEFPIRWYSFVYIFGFFLALHWGWCLWKKINKKEKINKDQFENLILGSFLFGVLGGRLGEFIFYSPQIFIYDFWEIFKPWHGGMSIHGGILGSILFIFFWGKKKNIPFLKITDVLVLPLVFTLFLGRGANFINGELVGTITDQSWGVIFPDIDNKLRHPSQLYEMIKNLILFNLIFYLFQKKHWKTPGFLSGTFLFGYGLLRFIIEFYKESTPFFYIFSTGQILCFVMICLGLILLNKSYKKREK